MSFEQEKMIVGSLPSLYPLQKFEEEAINALVSLPIDDDTISRKAVTEAIEKCHKQCCRTDSCGDEWIHYETTLNEVESIQPMPSNTSNALDSISRQAALGIAFKYCPDDDGTCSEAGTDLRDMIDELENLPPTQPSQTERKWILCNERMPEEQGWIGTKDLGTTISDEVYVTFENPKGERFVKELSFQNGKLSAFDKSAIDAFYKGSKPIAWMPKELPEPYKGVTE